MTTILKLFLLRWLATKSFGGALLVLGTLALPVAAALKVVGLPILAILGVVALPVALVLAVVGLPVLLIVGAVGFVLALVGPLLALGLLALKWVLPVVLIVWLVRWAVGRARARDVRPADTMGAAI